MGFRKSNQQGKPGVKFLLRIRQRTAIRLVTATLGFAGLLTVSIFVSIYFGPNKKAFATTNETLSTGSFIINMGITPQTYANGMKPYGMIYDLIIKYTVPIKWVIEPTKAKDGTDFTYNGTNYKGGPFIIQAEFITSTVASRISYWQTQGVQGVYTTDAITVPVYTTLTSFPNLMIDSLSSNQNIAVTYFNNAGIPPSAYGIGKPASLNACHDVWVNPHGDPRWADYSYLYNFVTVQKSYIWLQCHSGSVMEGCYNYLLPTQQLNYLSTKGLKCWKGGGGFNCDALITESHATSSTAPYTYYYPSDPIMQFMGNMSNPTQHGSEQWYQPMSTGAWRGTTKRLVTTATGASPNEGVLMAYGPGYGTAGNGLVMYTAGHDLNSGGGTVSDWVAAQRSFLNYCWIAGQAKVPLFVSYSIPVTFVGLRRQAVSATVSSGTPPYTYLWTSTIGGEFVDPTAASTYFIPPNPDPGPISGVLQCIVTDACGRRNFISQFISITNSPLPVTLSSFEAKAQNNKSVLLSWTTVAEVNNDYFTIERSADGKHFTELTRVDGVGNSTVLHKYSYTDNSPYSGKSFYRLMQTDFDGTCVLFKIVPVTIKANDETKSTVTVSPNPFSDEFTAQFECSEKEEVTINLITANGITAFSDKIIAAEGNNLYRFNAAGKIQPGTYLLKIGNSSTVFATKKVICR
ncbi:MAG: T9SS type A sorting domain-containing protein [Bacteroidia bacterium]